MAEVSTWQAYDTPMKAKTPKTGLSVHYEAQTRRTHESCSKLDYKHASRDHTTGKVRSYIGVLLQYKFWNNLSVLSTELFNKRHGIILQCGNLHELCILFYICTTLSDTRLVVLELTYCVNCDL